MKGPARQGAFIQQVPLTETDINDWVHLCQVSCHQLVIPCLLFALHAHNSGLLLLHQKVESHSHPWDLGGLCIGFDPESSREMLHHYWGCPVQCWAAFTLFAGTQSFGAMSHPMRESATLSKADMWCVVTVSVTLAQAPAMSRSSEAHVKIIWTTQSPQPWILQSPRHRAKVSHLWWILPRSHRVHELNKMVLT